MNIHRAIVTGASGFIGKKLIRELLNRNIRTCAVVRSTENLRDLVHSDLEIVECDFMHYNDLKNIIMPDSDVFFHLAWNGVFGKDHKNYYLQMNNVIRCCDALIAAADSGCRKFVFTSSVMTYEIALQNSRFYRDAHIYGNGKYSAEILCKTLSGLHGIEYCIATLANAYGPGERSMMIQNVLIKQLLEGISPKLIKGDCLHDWVFVDDVVGSLIAIAECGKNNANYYVGHRKLRTFREITTEVGKIVNPDIELKFGEFPDTPQIDYSNIDLERLYIDTGFEAKADFAASIGMTADWIKATLI